ncbi:uncharacterized protein BP5553_02900 [Venustampulla echinocandica]|uniref:Zn(2)-C6 fungal-type domain-containing protein n=1 Tax=Venustampulla echinocandica TaxID=2656787 RepID=A0A370TSQ5_9HELO|nr:uncharacterized protein BP5553_02900 [Venustampulla echinocandica]RDL38560.1 hypothetical protein BP5553_02900 [Venustampulla echinocandica]
MPPKRPGRLLTNTQAHTRGAATRQSKGRSNLGCQGCKKRRKKCDESQPICKRCRTLSYTCVYTGHNMPDWKSSQVSTFTIGAPAVSKSKIKTSPAADPVDHTRAAGCPEPSHSSLIFPGLSSDFTKSRAHALPAIGMKDNPALDNQENMHLLTYFKSKTSKYLIGNENLWAVDVLQLAFHHPFLIHAILSLSARHLHFKSIHTRSNRQSTSAHPSPSGQIYATLESKHHQRSLSLLRATFLAESYSNNYLRSIQSSHFATSFLLYFHACSALEFDPSGCGDTSFIFLRGIRSLVIASPLGAHQGVFASLLSPPLSMPICFPHAKPSLENPGAIFMNILDELPINSKWTRNKDIYVERMESLTLYLAICIPSDTCITEKPVLEEILLCFLRWQTFVNVPFLNLLGNNDPIALSILAYYYAAVKVVLNRADDEKYWWWRDKPEFIVRSIARYIGPEWETWISWPLAMVAL